MVDVDFKALIERLEQKTRQGQKQEVHDELATLNLYKIPRGFLASLADIAFRNNEFILSLQILNRVVRPKGHVKSDATEKELLVYATSLLSLGSIEESIEIFNSLNAEENPEVLLYGSFALFAQWKYHQSIKPLKKFVTSNKISAYRRLVGEVNLAAALVIDQSPLASELIVNLKESLLQDGHTLLLGNTMGIEGQNRILLGDFVSAKKVLLQALDLLKNQKGVYLLIIKKWLVICESLMRRGEASISEFSDLRRECLAQRYWEGLRDCDLFEAVVGSDSKMMAKVIQGTPYVEYQKRARAIWKNLVGTKMGGSQEFIWNLAGADYTSMPYPQIDLIKGEFAESVLGHFFKSLCLDFYKPARLGFIFSQTFPDEYFNPVTSPKRIEHLLYRTRKELLRKGFPLNISVRDGEWSLEANDFCAIRLLGRVENAKGISRVNLVDAANQGSLTLLHKAVGQKSFTTSLVSKSLGLTATSAARILQFGIKKGLIAKLGSGRGTTYRFVRRGGRV